MVTQQLTSEMNQILPLSNNAFIHNSSFRVPLAKVRFANPRLAKRDQTFSKNPPGNTERLQFSAAHVACRWIFFDLSVHTSCRRRPLTY
jgi:hypothetical protein